MITHIDGILEEKNPAYAVIDVNGVGYFLHITLTTFSSLPDKVRYSFGWLFPQELNSNKLNSITLMFFILKI